MPCAELKNLELERATITSAVDVAAGLFKPANARANPPAQSGPPPQPIPQHCRVTMVLKPTLDDVAILMAMSVALVAAGLLFLPTWRQPPVAAAAA